jgi:alkanesulfonate monooxygenase SsuD/methylene tetrahydromethanopterin reductase-like flavin-dependent oxidoreductase (luciferase family)
MELGFFTLPLHPSERPHGETMIEDRDSIVLADRLGYREAFVGEHLSDAHCIVTNSNMFLASLASATERIMLGSYSNMPQIHPAIMALHAALLDNIVRGRYILGVTPGTLRSDRELLETLDDDTIDRFLDAIDVMLRLWLTEPPYNVVGKRWTVTTKRSFYPEIGCGYIHKPYQLPFPRIVAGLETLNPHAAAEIGKRGFSPLSPPHVHPRPSRGPVVTLCRWMRCNEGRRRLARVAHSTIDFRRRRRRRGARLRNATT